jgi:hypothetical protein
MLTTAPSDTVKALLRQGKRREAMRVYRREGATGTDINYLNTAESIATDRSVSLDEALAAFSRTSSAATPPTTEPGSPTVSRRRSAGVYTLYALAVLTVVGAALMTIDAFREISFVSPPDPGGYIEILVGGAVLAVIPAAFFIGAARAFRHGALAGPVISTVVGGVVLAVLGVLGEVALSFLYMDVCYNADPYSVDPCFGTGVWAVVQYDWCLPLAVIALAIFVAPFVLWISSRQSDTHGGSAP